MSGPAGNRVMSAITIVELASRSVRELALKRFSEANSQLTDGAGVVKADRAKTALQMKRNDALRKALLLIQKDARAQGKSPEIEWKLEGTKDRAVKMGGQTVFLQTSSDHCGHFVAPYADLGF